LLIVAGNKASLKEEIVSTQQQQHPSQERWVACPHCDLLLPQIRLSHGQKARCPRCKYLLLESKKNSVERTFAVSLAGLIAFIPATTYPLLGLQAVGLENEASLLQCVGAMLDEGLVFAALLIFLFCMLVPFIRLLIICYLTLQIIRKRHNPFAVDLFRLFHEIEEWGMLEVFLLGLVVSLYKILGLADAVFGFGLFAFALLLLSATLVTFFLDEQLIWEKLGR